MNYAQWKAAIQALGGGFALWPFKVLADGITPDPNYGDPCAYWSASAYPQGATDPATGYTFPAPPANGVEQSAVVSSNVYAQGGSIYVLGDVMTAGITASYNGAVVAGTAATIAATTPGEETASWPSWMPFTEQQAETTLELVGVGLLGLIVLSHFL